MVMVKGVSPAAVLSLMLSVSGWAQGPDSPQGPAVLPPEIQAFVPLAAQGDLAAQVTLGRWYSSIVSTQGHPDYAQAVKWFGMAAEQGNARGQFELGRLYASGKGVPLDPVKAAGLFRKASAQGKEYAQVEYGKALKEGSGTKKSYREALECFKKAASQGNLEAMLLLGQMYAAGQGVPQDEAMATKWIGEALAGGFPDAEVYSEPLNLRGEAGAGITSSMVAYGKLAMDGHGILNGRNEAIKWIRKASDAGNAEAENLLGQYYLDGTNVVRNVPTGWLLLQRAAFDGDENARARIKEAMATPGSQKEAVIHSLKKFEAELLAQQSSLISKINQMDWEIYSHEIQYYKLKKIATLNPLNYPISQEQRTQTVEKLKKVGSVIYKLIMKADELIAKYKSINGNMEKLAFSLREVREARNFQKRVNE